MSRTIPRTFPLEVALALVAMAARTVLQRLVYWQAGQQEEQYHLLSDVGFHLVPFWAGASACNDALCYTILLVGLGACLWHERAHPPRCVTTLVRWWNMCNLLGVARGLTFNATLLFSAERRCAPDAYAPPRTLWDVLGTPAFPGQGYSCSDLIFSGHMLNVLSVTMLFWTRRRCWRLSAWVVPALLLANVLQSCLILAARTHYTVDVLVAWYVVPATWGALGAWVMPGETTPLGVLSRPHEPAA